MQPGSLACLAHSLPPSPPTCRLVSEYAPAKDSMPERMRGCSCAAVNTAQKQARKQRQASLRLHTLVASSRANSTPGGGEGGEGRWGAGGQ